jgi:hypothetical protein
MPGVGLLSHPHMVNEQSICLGVGREIRSWMHAMATVTTMGRAAT